MAAALVSQYLKRIDFLATQTESHTAAIDSATIATFATHELAETAVKELAAARFDITRISVIGRGYHSEEVVTGSFSTGDRVKFWGSRGTFWGGLWGLLFCGLFMTIPIVGLIVVVGHLAIIIASGVESAIVDGGIGAAGAALYGMGLPKDSALCYEKAIKKVRFLVVVHGTTSDVECARQILANENADPLEIHKNLIVNDSVTAAEAGGS
jgi:hypothetical protein